FEISPGYKQVKHHMREAASAHGVDYELLQAVIATESGFDAQAVSPKGALGLMQLRSEERRVGKECALLCRSRWAPCHNKKKIAAAENAGDLVHLGNNMECGAL